MDADTGPAGLTSISNDRRTRKTSEFIARDLVNYIVREELAPGARLPTEKDMVESFGVGRTTLREALRLLETRGVITIRSGPRGGPVVRRPKPADLAEALTLILQFEGDSLADVLEARRLFEPIITRVAASRIADEQIGALQETVDAIAGNLRDHDVFQAENRRFNDILSRASGSTVLRVFHETLRSMTDDVIYGIEYTPNRRKAAAVAHQQIVDAMRGGDDAAAEAAMRQHMDEAAVYWFRKFSDLASRPVRWLE